MFKDELEEIRSLLRKDEPNLRAASFSQVWPLQLCHQLQRLVVLPHRSHLVETRAHSSEDCQAAEWKAPSEH